MTAVALRNEVVLIVSEFGAAVGAVGALLGRRWRLAALGAGGELREFEQARTGLVPAWRSRHGVRTRGRTYIASQGELVRERSWPETETFVPMAASGAGRVPRRAGRHLLIVGRPGRARRLARGAGCWRGSSPTRVGVLVTDPKGNQGLEADLRAGARVPRRPLVLFDPRAEGKARYYADLLQIHLGIVAEALRAAGLWAGEPAVAARRRAAARL